VVTWPRDWFASRPLLLGYSYLFASSRGAQSTEHEDSQAWKQHPIESEWSVQIRIRRDHRCSKLVVKIVERRSSRVNFVFVKGNSSDPWSTLFNHSSAALLSFGIGIVATTWLAKRVNESASKVWRNGDATAKYAFSERSI